jgi:hypothetical protein
LLDSGESANVSLKRDAASVQGVVERGSA